MKIFYLIVCTTVLASCSRTGGNSLLPADPNVGTAQLSHATHDAQSSSARQVSNESGYKVVYAFGTNPGADGWYPFASLTDMAGELYSTTELGGGTTCISDLGCGTVFKMNASGNESLLYRFGSSSKAIPDGSGPTAGLMALNGTLYGTTSEGGLGTACNSPRGDCGTVFKVSASGEESVLYSFKGGTDGAQPWAAPIAVNGMFYGTTISGGAAGFGTVFSLTPSGKETVLYSFKNGADGAYPYGGLTLLDGALYGTTFAGGSGAGYGTVFKIGLSGNERVIYRFLGDGKDGQSPQASLIALNGKLYGTADTGGTNDNGAVFQVTTSGKETILYKFTGTAHGNPTGVLLALNGELYGTTTYGGSFICDTSQNHGCGTIFRLTMSGNETVLHNFEGTPDGWYPGGGLVAVNGKLFGTTTQGGPSNLGTVFEVSP